MDQRRSLFAGTIIHGRRASLFLMALLFLSNASANILGNMQTFSPSPDSLFFENIHASKTLKKNHFNLGFFTSYVRNELSAYDNLATQSFANYKDKSWTFDFVAAWGVTENFQIFYALPGFFDQSPDSGQSQNNYITKGVNAHRPGVKYDISQSADGGFAVVGSVDFPVAENDPYSGVNADPIYNLEMVYDIRNKLTAYGFNLGYRFRNPGDLPTNPYFFPLQDQIIYSFGYVTSLNTNHRYHFELYGATSGNKSPHQELKHVSALEGLFAYKQRLAKGIWGHIGATAELLPEGLAPQYRLYAGVNWFFGLESSADLSPTASESSLEVIPREIVLEKKETEYIKVTGGVKPYKFSLEHDFGRFNSSTMKYTAPNSDGVTELAVEDAIGTRVLVPIRVGRAERTAMTFEKMVVDPSSLELYEGGEAGFTVSGGADPITYRLSRPFGEFSSSSMTYFAPASTGSVDLIITDANKQRIIVPIRVVDIPKANKELVIKNLQFIFNSDQLTKKSKKILNSNIEKLRGEKIKKIVVAGHTDNIGKDAYNLVLSRQRAKAVAIALSSELGIDRKNIQGVGYGESKPIDTNKTDKGRQNNRRVELKLYY
jgi:OmpA-OmpF porin, OOP family